MNGKRRAIRHWVPRFLPVTVLSRAAFDRNTLKRLVEPEAWRTVSPADVKDLHEHIAN